MAMSREERTLDEPHMSQQIDLDPSSHCLVVPSGHCQADNEFVEVQEVPT